jgi:hypothetical protein
VRLFAPVFVLTLAAAARNRRTRRRRLRPRRRRHQGHERRQDPDAALRAVRRSLVAELDKVIKADAALAASFGHTFQVESLTLLSKAGNELNQKFNVTAACGPAWR